LHRNGIPTLLQLAPRCLEDWSCLGLFWLQLVRQSCSVFSVVHWPVKGKLPLVPFLSKRQLQGLPLYPAHNNWALFFWPTEASFSSRWNLVDISRWAFFRESTDLSNVSITVTRLGIYKARASVITLLKNTRMNTSSQHCCTCQPRMNMHSHFKPYKYHTASRALTHTHTRFITAGAYFLSNSQAQPTKYMWVVLFWHSL